MQQVDEAEREASEVLHSLLSVERIEKSDQIDINNADIRLSNQPFQTNHNNGVKVEVQMQNSTVNHSVFPTIEGNNHYQQNQQVVIWEGQAIPVDVGNQHVNMIYSSNSVEEEDKKTVFSKNDSSVNSNTPKKSPLKKKKKLVKKKKKGAEAQDDTATKLEESSAQVKERFKRGCECQDESCFRGLNPDNVYKHRLNIAELTKGEHDMYLMGVTMACLANPDTTVRQKERRRLRAQYVYQGRRVCLDAFLYLENCTHYQLKRIRKHVMTHGVAPRVHGNHGKKPHNTFPLDIYYHATEFLKQYLQQYTGERDVVNIKQPIQLPWDVTRKNLHDAYKDYGQVLEPGTKLMGYSTFRQFLKEQFAHVKFCKVEPKNSGSSMQQQSHQQDSSQQIQNVVMKAVDNVEHSNEPQQIAPKGVINNEVIPLIVAQPSDTPGSHQQTFLVTQQLISNSTQNANNQGVNNAYSYQLNATGYVISEQGNILTTMPSVEHHPQYTFSRI